MRKKYNDQHEEHIALIRRQAKILMAVGLGGIGAATIVIVWFLYGLLT